MQNRTPIAPVARPALPDFAPVPRKYRHDGWTPARQRAFVEALADTGSVTRAAGMVNMAQTNCYTLRRAPGAEGFRRAWDAALDFGVARLKDIAFERAVEGELIPVFHNGKLMGFRRKRNDALLIFCLRHYGQDAGGRRTTVNYFSNKAVAGVATGNGDAGAGAAASASTTLRTVSSGASASPEALALRDDRLAASIQGFDGVALDSEAEAAIVAALEECAARARAADAAQEEGGPPAIEAVADDPGEPFVRLTEVDSPYLGNLVPPAVSEDVETFVPGEDGWRLAGAEKPVWLTAFEDRTAAQALEDASPRGEDASPCGEDAVAPVKRPRSRRRKAIGAGDGGGGD